MSENDDEVAALVERLHSHARHATVLGNTQSTQDEYLAEWLYRFADEGHEAAVALDRALAAEAERDALRAYLEDARSLLAEEGDAWAAMETENIRLRALPEKIAQAIEAQSAEPRWALRQAYVHCAAIARSFGAAGEPA